MNEVLEAKKMEKVKVYDINMKPTEPYIATRKEVHKYGFWHKHFDCWIVRRDIDDDYVMFQLRSDRKSAFKNMLEVSASGHIESHEEVKDGVRELKEELGIDVDFKHLRFLGVFRNIMDIEENGKKEREFCHTYAYECPEQIEDYNLQREEVTGMYEMKISEAIKFFAGDLEKIQIRGYVKGYHKYEEDIKVIYQKDIKTTFVPYFGNYYLRVVLSLKRFLDGEKYIAL
ncbi:MAG: isopentenyl-diphosphate delta-isomerase [Alphaproteobacteria bacterium ADurb.Bin438]|nr:MAG: isopentenyl-diphosphate delta-isomerase [Alphaproteobacteria bacterium ADurb.Bin438]